MAEQYALQHSSLPDPLLVAIEEYTRAHHRECHMLSGPLQGGLLSLISRMVQPAHILEIGTFTGYSALCLAKGLQPDGVLHTIECREQDAAIAQQFFDRSPQRHQLRLHTGDARQVVPTLIVDWDLVFLDADKVSYMDYFNMVFPRLRKGGYILADNVFFHGQVFDAEPSGKNAKAIAAFNAFVKERTDIDVLLLPVRDGISIIRKL